jgi:hypothetical protein
MADPVPFKQRRHHMHEAGHEGMSGPEHDAMLVEQQKKFLWTHYTNILLGVWLMTTPVALGSLEPAVVWNDVLCGVLVVPLAVLALFRRAWAGWALCFLGIWLLFAPLVFWTTSAAVYLNDTVVGSLLIALSILIPGMPGMGWMPMPGPEIPPGWTYNPSSWLQRGPIIVLAFVGFFISRYLAAYQLGHISAAWDPFFGHSTEKVLTSDVSKAWPISDAGLGAVAYMLEALSGYMGDSRRWRTMPWMVLMFALLVVPLGATSIILVILQPLSIGLWCSLCLFAAAGMLVMVPLAVDEVIAMGQFMRQSLQEGRPFWRTFWMGGSVAGGGPDQPAPRFPEQNVAGWMPAMVWGLTVPWSLAVATVLGIWLMGAPAVLATEGLLADSEHVVGALVVTCTVIAWAEVTRSLRWLNVLFGIWLLTAPWLLSGSTATAIVHDMLIGAVLILISLPRGSIKEGYGGWNQYAV